jgi:hypothetical protein
VVEEAADEHEAALGVGGDEAPVADVLDVAEGERADLRADAEAEPA